MSRPIGAMSALLQIHFIDPPVKGCLRGSSESLVALAAMIRLVRRFLRTSKNAFDPAPKREALDYEIYRTHL